MTSQNFILLKNVKEIPGNCKQALGWKLTVRKKSTADEQPVWDLACITSQVARARELESVWYTIAFILIANPEVHQLFYANM